MKGLPPPFIDYVRLIEAILWFQLLREMGGKDVHIRVLLMRACHSSLSCINPTALEDYSGRGSGGRGERFLHTTRQQHKGYITWIVSTVPCADFVFVLNLGFKVLILAEILQHLEAWPR